MDEQHDAHVKVAFDNMAKWWQDNHRTEVTDMTQATPIRVLPDLQAEIALLRAENARLLAARPKAKVSLKVTEKGGVSMYGLGRFPVTLYRGQWERLLEAMPEVKAFLEANASQLSVKD